MRLQSQKKVKIQTKKHLKNIKEIEIKTDFKNIKDTTQFLKYFGGKPLIILDPERKEQIGLSKIALTSKQSAYIECVLKDSPYFFEFLHQKKHQTLVKYQENNEANPNMPCLVFYPIKMEEKYNIIVVDFPKGRGRTEDLIIQYFLYKNDEKSVIEIEKIPNKILEPHFFESKTIDFKAQNEERNKKILEKSLKTTSENYRMSLNLPIVQKDVFESYIISFIPHINPLEDKYPFFDYEKKIPQVISSCALLKASSKGMAAMLYGLNSEEMIQFTNQMKDEELIPTEFTFENALEIGSYYSLFPQKRELQWQHLRTIAESGREKGYRFGFMYTNKAVKAIFEDLDIALHAFRRPFPLEEQKKRSKVLLEKYFSKKAPNTNKDMINQLLKGNMKQSEIYIFDFHEVLMKNEKSNDICHRC